MCWLARILCDNRVAYPNSESYKNFEAWVQTELVCLFSLKYTFNIKPGSQISVRAPKRRPPTLHLRRVGCLSRFSSRSWPLSIVQQLVTGKWKGHLRRAFESKNFDSLPFSDSIVWYSAFSDKIFKRKNSFSGLFSFFGITLIFCQGFSIFIIFWHDFLPLFPVWHDFINKIFKGTFYESSFSDFFFRFFFHFSLGFFFGENITKCDITNCAHCKYSVKTVWSKQHAKKNDLGRTQQYFLTIFCGACFTCTIIANDENSCQNQPLPSLGISLPPKRNA